MILSKSELAYAKRARVAHLATVDSKGNPHVVPLVFAMDREAIYFVVDEKTKGRTTLRRIRNISETGKATVLIDNYSEDWSKLSYLMIYCEPKILGPGESLPEKKKISKLLKAKYPQYLKGSYFPLDLDDAYFVKLVPRRATFWRNLRLSVV